MGINAVGPTDQGSRIQNISLNPEVQEKLASLREKLSEDKVEMSEAGKWHSFMLGLSEEDRAGMREFMHEIHQAIRSGDFDAEKMAEKAPDALKAFTEKEGIALEDLLAELASRMEMRMEVFEELKALAEENGLDLEQLREQYLAPGRAHRGVAAYGMKGMGTPVSDEEPSNILLDALFREVSNEEGNDVT